MKLKIAPKGFPEIKATYISGVDDNTAGFRAYTTDQQMKALHLTSSQVQKVKEAYSNKFDIYEV